VSDPTTICNDALAELGQHPIDSLDAGTQLSNTCRLMYPDARDAVLTMAVWHFARFLARLTRSDVIPAFKWDAQYLLPTTPYCLKVLLTSAVNSAPYEIGAYFNTTTHATERVLWSNETSLSIEYVGRVEDLSSWSHVALQVLVKMLASKLAKALTGQTALAEEKLKEATTLLQLAIAGQEAEDNPVQLYEPDADELTSLSLLNQVLMEVGKETVGDFAEDVESAHAVRVHYATALDTTLEMHPWNFAKSFTWLLRSSRTPAFKWRYQYALPNGHPAGGSVRLLDQNGAVWWLIVSPTGVLSFTDVLPAGGITFAGEDRSWAEVESPDGTTWAIWPSPTGTLVANTTPPTNGEGDTLTDHLQDVDGVFWDVIVSNTGIVSASAFTASPVEDSYCLTVLGTDQGNGAWFEIGHDAVDGRVLYSDEATVGIEYIGRVSDLTMWSALAIQVLVKVLASKVAPSLMPENKPLPVEKLKEAFALLPVAQSRDGREGSPSVLRPPTLFLAARTRNSGVWPFRGIRTYGWN
jgi:hypothetical protein